MVETVLKHKNISHHSEVESFDNAVAGLKREITERGGLPDTTTQEQLDILEELSKFPFGRFMIAHRGLDGYWTDYLVHQGKKTIFDDNDWIQERKGVEIEEFILTKAPAALATQERFHIFKRLIQEQIRSDIIVCSLPCGVMGDILSLDYSNVENVRLIGVDIDDMALNISRERAKKRNMDSILETINSDAWSYEPYLKFNLLVSSGLTIYEPDNQRVVDLYKRFFNALKPGGVLITSFFTPPPTENDCPWDFSQINMRDANRAKIIISDVLQANWQVSRSYAETTRQLTKAGFSNLSFFPDRANIFPTVRAERPS